MYKYMVFVKDNAGYPVCCLKTDDYYKAIAEMEWFNETDPLRRSFGVQKLEVN